MDPNFLKCRICEKHLQPPIRRCGTHSTHMFCEKCITNKNNKCTICQSPVSSTNDVALEALLNIQKYKCKNENCRMELLSLNQKLDHERNCKFEGGGRHKCAFNEFQNSPKPCPWIGPYNLIEEHFHNHLPPLAENLIQIQMNSTNAYTQLVKACSQLFWYKHFVDIEAQKVYFLMQAINYNKNNKFEFKIKFFSLFDSNKTWTLKRDCYDASEDADAYFMAGRSINAGFKNLRPFIHENIVNINFDIKKKSNNENDDSRAKADRQFEKENRSFVKGQIESTSSSTSTAADSPFLPSSSENVNPPSYDEATDQRSFVKQQIDRKKINTEIKNTPAETLYPASTLIQVEPLNIPERQADNAALLSNYDGTVDTPPEEHQLTLNKVLIVVGIIILTTVVSAQLNPQGDGY